MVLIGKKKFEELKEQVEELTKKVEELNKKAIFGEKKAEEVASLMEMSMADIIEGK